MSYQKGKINETYSLGVDSDHKNKSNRKRQYKYTENEFNIEPAPSNRKSFKASYQVKDFSFEHKAPKQYYKKYTNQNTVNEVAMNSNNKNMHGDGNKESAQKKDVSLRVNNIDTLNDKITSLLTKVQKEELKPLEPNVNNYSSYNKNNYSYTSKYNHIASPIQPTDKLAKKDDKDLISKKRVPYVGSATQRYKTPKNEQQEAYQQNKQKYQRRQQNSSPIGKYDFQTQQLGKPNKDLPRYTKQTKHISQSIIKNNDQILHNNIQSSSKYVDEMKMNNYRNQRLKKYENYENKAVKQLQKKEVNLMKNAQLDYKINKIQTKINHESPRKYITMIQQSRKIEDSKVDRSSFHQLTQQPTILKMAHQLSRIIDLDVVLRKIRMSFQTWKDANKWETLKLELRVKNIYIEESELKQMASISIHERNPFGEKIQAFPLNGCKDFAKIYAQIIRIWNENVYKCVSLNNLALDHFEIAHIDLNRSGKINIQDLVCFVNVNTQKFYRPRDVCQLFNRFLKMQGKSLQKNIGDGILYSTFMERLCK